MQKQCRVVSRQGKSFPEGRETIYEIREGRAGKGEILWEAAQRAQPASSCVHSILEDLINAAIQDGYTVFDEYGREI